MPTWVGSPERVCEGAEAEANIAQVNDGKYYTQPELGIIKVDWDRWKAAQNFERQGWTVCWSDSQSDRNHEHHALFKGYEALPRHLGHMIEVGCGPFTQSATILETHTADSITLLDPLLESYPGLPHCSYKSGKLRGLPTTFMPFMAELLEDKEKYDTLVCINVLEHVMDAYLVLDNIHQALKPGGILVMGERTHDEFEPHKSYDVGHPICIKTPVLQAYKCRFNILYENGDYFIGTKIKGTNG